MQLSTNTSKSKIKNNLIKVILILVIAIGTMVVLGNIEFPSPNKEIEKFIPNEKLRTIK
jgi:hypothetical protein|tara:strand:+ start:415 stop:591 length:177 start_codon:yes stop_codon:yes gene_type:complete